MKLVFCKQCRLDGLKGHKYQGKTGKILKRKVPHLGIGIWVFYGIMLMNAAVYNN